MRSRLGMCHTVCYESDRARRTAALSCRWRFTVWVEPLTA
jgi:hypothetical protein